MEVAGAGAAEEHLVALLRLQARYPLHSHHLRLNLGYTELGCGDEYTGLGCGDEYLDGSTFETGSLN